VDPFYAVKCNPDPLIIKTLALFGCNFDCASRNEIRLVQEATQNLPQTPDIVFANPCKARAHVHEAVCKGVRLMTFDNAAEVEKCAAISKHIQLILRIITDDRGSQCRLSTKFGAPRHKWRPLLAAAKKHGLQVVGVSFHVGSGCRDSSRYELALRDAREIFDMAETEFRMKMHILDIGGGFPGETHSMWNPAVELDEEEDADDDEGKASDGSDDGATGEIEEKQSEQGHVGRYMFFNEIAEAVAPMIDELFPPDNGVRVIGEPGRYFVAACTTLCCSVVGSRNNAVDSSFKPEAVDDNAMSAQLNDMSRDQEEKLVHRRSMSRGSGSQLMDNNDGLMTTLQEELGDYAELFATQQ
jgi:ornithine decarboxylase